MSFEVETGCRPPGYARRSAREAMDAFPFTNVDWERVKDAAHPVLEARLADDDAVADSMFLSLQETLADLRRKYGDHPVLLETEADFCDDTGDSIALYNRALSIARENSLPTVSICLSYARTLIDETGDANAARRVLKSCREEVHRNCDESDGIEYEELTTLLGLPNRDTM